MKHPAESELQLKTIRIISRRQLINFVSFGPCFILPPNGKCSLFKSSSTYLLTINVHRSIVAKKTLKNGQRFLYVWDTVSPVLNYKLFYTSYPDYIKPQNRKHLVKCLIYRPDELMTTKESRLNSIIGVTLKEAKYFISVVYHQALSNLPVTRTKQNST